VISSTKGELIATGTQGPIGLIRNKGAEGTNVKKL
jgi:hypothetical protein